MAPLFLSICLNTSTVKIIYMHYLTKNSVFTKGKGRQERLSTALYPFGVLSVPSSTPGQSPTRAES